MTNLFKTLPGKLTLVTLLVAFAGGGVWYTQKGGAPAATKFSTAKVQRGDLTVTVSATGTLNPVVSVLVGSQVSGVIQRLNADFNSHVKKGQVIAQIEASLFQTQVAQAQANLHSTEAMRDKAAVAVRDAQRQLDRVTELRGKSLVSDSELDAARFAQESASVEQRVREAAVAQAQASLEQAQVSFAHTTIYAPIDGVVVSRDVDVGQTVAASLQAPTLFTIAQDLTRMQIETEVDEAFIGVVREGQPVKFSVFAYPSRTFSGQVAQVRLKPKVESGVVKYNCVLVVDNKDSMLKPGMTATVTIDVDKRDKILKVPNAALRFVPELPQEELKKMRTELKRGEALLWVVNPAGLEPLRVQTGLVGEKETEVSGAALEENMTIAVPESVAKGAQGGPRPPGMRLF
ncbi:MAG: efflux RND transporter periplasmic adaptor subunit [Gammaproteobacteria bacterium]|nr:efflux RND transporter periplasmic adaptor subunit [Gammaproteobacteria bacterium]